MSFIKSRILFTKILILALLVSTLLAPAGIVRAESTELPVSVTTATNNASQHVIQLVLDGLDNELYTKIKMAGANTPNLDQLIDEGTRLNAIKTVIPAFGGSQAAALTGASMADNGFTYKHYDREENKVIQNQFSMQGETVFEAIYRKEGSSVLASGWSVGNSSIDGRGVSTTDPNFLLKEYELGKQNATVPFATVADDIINAIKSENIPSLLTAYSNDIRMVAWEKSDVATNLQKSVDALESIDAKLGLIMQAVADAGIENTTTFIVHSLSDSSIVAKKYTTLSLANAITTIAGVKTKEVGTAAFTYGELAVEEDAKAVLVKQYVMHNAQLYFTKNATEEDKQSVISYLNSKAASTNVAAAYTPEELGLDRNYGDLILVPVEGLSFAATSTNNYKTGKLDFSPITQIHEPKEMFFVAAGANILPGGQIRGGATVGSVAATIANLLGADTPSNAEEGPWLLEDLAPVPVITLTTPNNNSTVYSNPVELSGFLNTPSEITINDQLVNLDEYNAFVVEIPLQEGLNEIVMKAVNKDGIVTIQNYYLTYTDRSEVPEGNIGVYFNLDGFADYYLHEALSRDIVPNLKKILEEEGVYFSNARAIIPSITNPSQVAMAAGASPKYTGNHYRYFNKEQNKVIQETPARLQKAETIAEAAFRQHLDVLSINQFAFENMGTFRNSKHNNYVDANGDGMARFDEFIKLIRENKTSDGMVYENIPRFIALYADDLDSIGHNESGHYNPLATTETERMQYIMARLALLDQKIGELITASKEAGIYDEMTFVLSTDHGMSNFGIQQSSNEDNAATQLPDLMATIDALGEGYKTEFLHPNQASVPTEPSEGTDIVVVTAGLQVQLSYVNEFDEEVIAEKNANILEAIQDKVYLGETMSPEGIALKGSKEGFADFIISPKTPYHFHAPSMIARTARGQHDSLETESQKVAAFMWGKDVKKGFQYEEEVSVIDFMPTLAFLMGINLPLDSNGEILYDALIDKAPLEEYSQVIEAEEGLVKGKSRKFNDSNLSNGVGVLLPATNQSYLEFVGVPASRKINVSYSSLNDFELELYVNEELIRTVFFPETNSNTEYDVKTLNLTLKQGDIIKFVYADATNTSEIRFDSLAFISNEPNEPVNITGAPFAIAMTPDEDTETSMRFNWLTNEGVIHSIVQIVEFGDGAHDFSQATEFVGSSDRNGVRESGVGKVYMSHKVTADGLKPGTKYAYKVGDGTTFSDVGTFTTATENGDFTFLYLTDSQGKTEKDYDIWSQIYKEAYSRFDDARFTMMTGDLVDTGLNVPNEQNEWLQFFSKPQDVFMHVPMAPLVGNHEGMSNNGYGMHFNTPDNARHSNSIPASGVYSFDYGDVHIAVLNTEMLTSIEDFEPQIEWLKQDMIKTDKKWKIVAQHKALYSVGPHIRDTDINNVLIPTLLPVIDELGIDLVLQGHDHVFARSGQIKNGERTDDIITNNTAVNPDGTLYLINNTAGFKFYEPQPEANNELFDRTGQHNTQTYTGITLSGDQLKLTTYTLGVDIPYDEYTIEKTEVKPERVSNLEITQSGDKVELSFQGVEGAVGYYIYEKNGEYLPNWSHFIPQGSETQSYSLVLDIAEGQSSNFAVKTMSERAMSLAAYVINYNNIDAVIEGINELPATITLGDKEKVVAARNAYEALTADEKLLVTNIDKLIAAEAKLVELEGEQTPPSGGGGSAGGIILPEIPSKRVEVIFTMDQVAEKIAKAVSEAQSAGTAVDHVVLYVEAKEGVEEIEAILPREALAEILKIEGAGVTLATPLATLTFDSLSLEGMLKSADDKIAITISAVAADELPEEMKGNVGSRPILRFKIMSGDETISQFNGNVKVSIPYTAKSGEDVQALVIYYVDNGKTPVLIKESYYDAEAKALIFVTNHFSEYAVGYNKVNFSDVSGGWYESYVNYLAARSIINGDGKGKFNPDSKITRAEFVQMMAGLNGVDLSKYKGSSFIDVDESAWYASAINWASDQGIVLGTGVNQFTPDAHINRQDIATIIARYAAKIGYDTPKANELHFVDKHSIAEYAAPAVSTLQQMGIIEGKPGNLFHPAGLGTRAESAKMMAEFFKLIMQ